MDKQYSVKFFASLIESIQKVCRDYLDFEQAVDISGYLCVEIDSYRKERYVLSELIQNTGDIVSESYCTKAFKTLKKFPSDVGGIENSELTRLSASAETSNISRINSRRCESSSRTSGYNTSNTESGFCTNQRNPYKLLPPGLKRTIPWQNRSSPKRERNESYRISQENSEDYSNVHHSGSNNYLPEPASDSIVLPVNTLDNTSSSASVAENSTCNTVPSVNETIRLPLNVKVKEENDSSFMDEQGYENTRMYSDKNSQNSYIHAQTENNETLPTSSSLSPGDQENAHTARKMKGHVKLFQVTTDSQMISSDSHTPPPPSGITPQGSQVIQQMMLSSEGETVVSKTRSCFECQKCFYTFRDLARYKEHLQIYHPEIFYCEICGRSFDDEQCFSDHICVVNHEGKRKFPCPYGACCRSFARQSHLMDHVNTHSGLKPYICPNCHKHFTGKYIFNRHSKTCCKKEENNE